MAQNGIYVNVTTPNAVRCDWVFVLSPRHSNLSGKDEYTVTMLIPKTDSKTLDVIKKAFNTIIDAERRGDRNGAWDGKCPPAPALPLHDGDKPKDNGNEWGPQCKGCWVMTATTAVAPGRPAPKVVDASLNDIIDPTAVYSCCWMKINMNLKSYDAGGKKGIKAYLQGAQKIRDDEPIGGAMSVDSMFSVEADEPADPFNPFG